MKSTHKIPNIHLSQFKRAKIIATVGPSTDSYEAILALIEAGANGIRLNFSHGSHEERVKQIAWIRKASKAYGKPVSVIQDIQGPKIRLGDFEGVIPVQAGQSLVLQYNADYERSGHIPTQYDLSKKVKRGEQVLIFDGKVRTIVTSVKDGLVHVQVENDGVLLKRKGINLPDTDFDGDVITSKDRKDVAFGSTIDIDYIAQSFVQTAADIEQLRKILRNLGSRSKIIAKIETNAAIENMEEIIQAADAVMVARGDLAIETLAEAVPVVQRRIIALCRKYAKPSIVATQMLATMTESPEPTRAEVSDVATAVLMGADCVMLSDETANGRYPVHAVATMKKVIRYTEENAALHDTAHAPHHQTHNIHLVDQPPTKQSAICNAVITLADQVKAVAVVAETRSGATAINIAARRPKVPIISVTSDPKVAQQLGIVYGTKNYVRPDNKMQATKLTNWLRQNNVLEKGQVIVTASGKYPGVVGTTDTIKVRILE
jgi:pyruvate kinase